MLTKKIIKLREDALKIFKAGLSATKAEKIIKEKVKLKKDLLYIERKKYNLGQLKKIFVIGAGKASAHMAKAIEKILGEKINCGLIITKYDYLAPLRKIELIEAGHPIPDKNSLGATKKIKGLLELTDKKTLVIVLISGGGSSLLCLPVRGVSLKDIQKVTKLLLACGATIHEINTIRKHLSQVKGGNLARMIEPAECITLIVSDVIGDDLDVIASGPTVADKSTFKKALDIIKKYKLTDKVSKNILKHLLRGAKEQIPETPKKNDLIFKNIYNLIIVNNKLALRVAQEKARELGYQTKILSSAIKGEARNVAGRIINQGQKTFNSKKKSRPICLILGGETTVTVKGKGKGGRCQEFVLASAIEITGRKNLVVLAGGTDGTDGPTDAAGAIADTYTLARAQTKHLDAHRYLVNNDSYHFFRKLGDLIITGPTHTNVMDLYLILIYN